MSQLGLKHCIFNADFLERLLCNMNVKMVQCNFKVVAITICDKSVYHSGVYCAIFKYSCLMCPSQQELYNGAYMTHHHAL